LRQQEVRQRRGRLKLVGGQADDGHFHQLVPQLLTMCKNQKFRTKPLTLILRGLFCA
jgi:hypothetical protein